MVEVKRSWGKPFLSQAPGSPVRSSHQPATPARYCSPKITSAERMKGVSGTSFSTDKIKLEVLIPELLNTLTRWNISHSLVCEQICHCHSDFSPFFMPLPSSLTPLYVAHVRSQNNVVTLLVFVGWGENWTHGLVYAKYIHSELVPHARFDCIPHLHPHT